MVSKDKKRMRELYDALIAGQLQDYEDGLADNDSDDGNEDHPDPDREELRILCEERRKRLNDPALRHNPTGASKQFRLQMRKREHRRMLELHRKNLESRDQNRANRQQRPRSTGQSTTRIRGNAQRNPQRAAQDQTCQDQNDLGRTRDVITPPIVYIDDDEDDNQRPTGRRPAPRESSGDIDAITYQHNNNEDLGLGGYRYNSQPIANPEQASLSTFPSASARPPFPRHTELGDFGQEIDSDYKFLDNLNAVTDSLPQTEGNQSTAPLQESHLFFTDDSLFSRDAADTGSHDDIEMVILEGLDDFAKLPSPGQDSWRDSGLGLTNSEEPKLSDHDYDMTIGSNDPRNDINENHEAGHSNIEDIVMGGFETQKLAGDDHGNSQADDSDVTKQATQSLSQAATNDQPYKPISGESQPGHVADPVQTSENFSQNSTDDSTATRPPHNNSRNNANDGSVVPSESETDQAAAPTDNTTSIAQPSFRDSEDAATAIAEPSPGASTAVVQQSLSDGEATATATKSAQSSFTTRTDPPSQTSTPTKTSNQAPPNAPESTQLPTPTSNTSPELKLEPETKHSFTPMRFSEGTILTLPHSDTSPPRSPSGAGSGPSAGIVIGEDSEVEEVVVTKIRRVGNRANPVEILSDEEREVRRARKRRRGRTGAVAGTNDVGGQRDGGVMLGDDGWVVDGEGAAEESTGEASGNGDGAGNGDAQEEGEGEETTVVQRAAKAVVEVPKTMPRRSSRLNSH
jgi:hypothetical protein